jgi:large subunit ribosomal protein L14e
VYVNWEIARFEAMLNYVQILLDGPASKPEAVVPRHSAPIAGVILTPIVIAKLPLSARTGAVKKLWEKEEVESKWEKSSWAKGRAQTQKRKALGDFERFKVMKLRKQVSATFPILSAKSGTI